MSYQKTRIIVVTGVNGTLLDLSTGSFSAAMPALNRLRLLQIPWVLNTKKTLAELEVWREKLLNPYPMILENGAGIALPKGFEDAFFSRPNEDYIDHGEFCLKPMGMPRNELLNILEPAYDQYQFIGFDRMAESDLQRIWDVDDATASNALERYFNEPILWQDSDEAYESFKSWAREQGLYVDRGYQFVHVSGNADKGNSMRWLMNCFAQDEDKPLVVALGDDQSDISMLNRADISVVVRSPRHEPIHVEGKQKTIVADGVGPEGWNTAVLDLLDIYGD